MWNYLESYYNLLDPSSKDSACIKLTALRFQMNGNMDVFCEKFDSLLAEYC